MATLGTLEYLISVNQSQLNSGLGSAENKVKGFGNRMSTWAVAKGQMLGRFIERAGMATFRFIKGSVEESMAFDKSMAQVAATLGKSTDEIKDLSDFAREMGSKTAFTAQEAAQGLNYMALAGYSAEKSMAMLPKVLNLAAAGNMDLAKASDMVTDAESALGLTMDGTERLIDQMAMTASKSNTSVEQLGEAILTVGGTAKLMGEDTEMLNATLGILADNGIKGAEGGTALRNVLLSLSAPTDKAAKQLKKLDVSVFDAQGNMRSMEDIMLDMGDAMKDMTQEERTSIISDIFNKRDLKAVEALLGTTGDRWTELLLELTASKGSAEQMANTQLENLAGDATKFKSALGEAKLTLVEGLTPQLRKFVQNGTKWVQRLTNAFKKGGLKGALNEAWEGIKEGAKQLAGLVFGFNTDGTVHWPTWDDVKEAALAAWEKIKEGAASLAGLIFGKNEDGTVKWPTWEDVKAAAEAAWKTIVEGAASLTGIEFGNITSVQEAITAIGTKWTELKEKIEQNLIDIGTAFFGEGNADTVATAIKTVGDALPALLAGVAAFTGVVKLQQIVSAIKSLFTLGSGANTTALAFAAIASAIVLIAQNWDEIVATFDKATAWMNENIFQPMGEWIQTNIMGPVQDVIDWVNKAINEVKRALGLRVEGEITKADAQQLKTAYQMDKAQGNDLYESGFVDLLTSKLQEAGIEGEKAEAIINKIVTANDPAWVAAFIDNLTNADEMATVLGSDLEKAAGEYDADFNINVNDPYGILNGGSTVTESGGRRPRRPKAKGDWNVPYDNYPALLHRNEMVLTASQARRYRDGEGNADVVSAIQSLRNDMRNMKLVVGRKTFGRAVVDYGGDRMNGYIGGSDSRAAAGYGT